MRCLRIIGIAAVFLLACSGKNSTINRVVDSYYDKAQFNPNWEKGLLSPEWYYRMTVVDAPPNSKALSIADGNWLHVENIRFEITEFYLIGWRTQASVPGSDGESLPGGKENYKGTPVVVFKILSHFDVAPNYDPMTSTRGNLLVENKTDRSWYKRRFMKVDFSKNIAQELQRQDNDPWIWGFQEIKLDNAFAVGQNEPSNPKRSRFEEGYFEITTRQGVKTDIDGYFGDYGDPFLWDSSAPVFDIRYSFLRKPEKTNYQPLNYTNKMFDQFGFYRAGFTGQQKWNPYRGSLESEKNYNVTRFNIWNEDGSPKPIIYYTSVSHPRSLMNASRKVASEWNQIFKQLVFELKKSEVPEMFILKENSCNYDNINTLLTGELKNQVEEIASVKLSEIKTRLDEANDPNSESSFTDNNAKEARALDDLEKICSAFEYFTNGQENAFRYQRSGDLRYNLLNLINKRVMTNWSGLGPMFADMETGEIIQSQANVNLWYVDRRAQQAVETMDMVTGGLKFKEMIFGHDVHKYMSMKMQTIKRETDFLPTENAVLKLNQKLPNQIDDQDQISESQVSTRLAEINGTRFLQKIWHEKDFDPISDFNQRSKRIYRQALGVADPPEFLDNLVTGVALQFKHENPKRRFLKIREAVYTATMLHEVGHNLGLTHNMSASSDALNYGELFWRFQSLPPTIKEAFALTKIMKEALGHNEQIDKMQKILLTCAKDSVETWGYMISPQECFRQQEYMYSSIMDYHASWNADLAGLGTYDKAAIFFGYGQLVEVFPENNLTAEAQKKGLSEWLFLNDWKKIPRKFLNNSNQINQRSWKKYAEDIELPNRVPYKFCLDSSGWYEASCRAFDFGPDMRTRAAHNKARYWEHYFLTHFSRDRIWSMGNDLSSVVLRDLEIFEDFNQIMRWYGFYSMTNPEFKNSDTGKDYLAAVVTGLNHYSHVLGHPVSGEHLTTLENTKLLQPVDELDTCALDNVTILNDKEERFAIKGHSYATVYLGDGRPFAFGINNDYEDYHLNYVGSFYAKLLAGYFLAYPGGSFPRVDPLKDSKLFRMSWYRLFPDEVSELFSKMIRSEWEEFGPLINPEGELIHRDLLEVETLERPNYTGLMPVMPAVADMLPYRSLYYASALLSLPQMTEFSPIRSMQIGLEGGIDDRKSAEASITFENPFDGTRLWATKAGNFPIAYDYLKKLNTLNEKVNLLKSCLAGTSKECPCFKTEQDGECCSPSNPDCKEVVPRDCSQKELSKQLEQKNTELKNAIEFANDMRGIVQRYTTLR